MKTIKNDYDHTIVITKDELNFSMQEWKLMEEIVESAVFEHPRRGDTDEELSIKIMRAKKPTDPNIYNQPLLNIIQKKDFSDFLKDKLGMKDYYIDRVQIHKYDVNDFISLHCDVESCSDYKYTIVLHMNDNYEGGEFRVKDNDGNLISFKLNKYNLLATDSRLFHEVTKITQGVRKVIVWFVSEKDLTKDTLLVKHKVA